MLSCDELKMLRGSFRYSSMSSGYQLARPPSFVAATTSHIGLQYLFASSVLRCRSRRVDSFCDRAPVNARATVGVIPLLLRAPAALVSKESSSQRRWLIASDLAIKFEANGAFVLSTNNPPSAATLTDACTLRTGYCQRLKQTFDQAWLAQPSRQTGWAARD